MKTRWAFDLQNKADETISLSIYDVVGDPYGDAPTAKQVLDSLSANKTAKAIDVRINSVGGLVFDGLAIYNVLAQHPAKVAVHVDGLAASIASVIAMAGDTITMAENAMMMIHDPSAISWGDAAEMRKTADWLDKVRDQLVGIYAARTGQKPEDVKAAMTAETWMTAAEAKELGYATDIAPAKSAEAKAGAAFNMTEFRRVPGAALALIPPPIGVAPVAKTEPTPEVTITDSAAGVPQGSKASPRGATPIRKIKMTKEELRAQHPELYAAVVAEGKTAGVEEGTANERKRVLAHLKLGATSGATKVAHDAIASGASTMDESVFAEYQSAAMSRRDTENRQADSNAAGKALDNAAAPAAATETRDIGDAVADMLNAGKGKK